MNVRVDGGRLKDLRRQRALERRDLEEKSGVHWTTIARIELGQTTTRLSTVKKLADALGVDPANLVGDEVVA